jgi:quinol monooxygenase YgiN
MPVIAVTRLRLRDPALLDEFFIAAVAVLEQAKNSSGNLGADVFADAHNTWWTLTAWRERDSIQAFMGTEPHLSTMARLDDWCDEATFADWEQASEELPDWRTSHRQRS